MDELKLKDRTKNKEMNKTENKTHWNLWLYNDKILKSSRSMNIFTNQY